MNDDVIIRPALESDYDAIVAVWVASGLPIKPAGRDTRESFARQLLAFSTSYLVAECANHVVGVVLGTHDGRKGWINRLAVMPTVQRRGIARRLIESCERALADQGIDIIAALVESENAPSASLFLRCGYRDDVPVRYFRKLRRPDV